MLIFSPSTYELVEKNCSVKTADKLLLPVVYGFMCEKPRSQWSMTDSQLSTADQTGVHIRVSFVSDDLKAMAIYLENLYFWFLWVQLLHWNGSDERKYSVARQRRDKSTRSLVSQVSGICRYLKWRMVFFPI